MCVKSLLRIALVLAMTGMSGIAAAQSQHSSSPHHPGGEQGVLRLLPSGSVTQHSIDTAQGKLAYTATAGMLPLYSGSGERSGSIFYTAYVKKDEGSGRPLTFVFNGGPGAASAFLHLGLAGPRILDLGPNARDVAHAKLHDNPDTWLRFTDLVFIDPIGTGWSRTVKPEDAKHFWSVDSDAESMAKAIALYVAKNNRDGSPKYILGESYGGFRAAKVARSVQHDQGIVIAGIVMLSPLLEGWLTFGDDQSALNSALILPSLAAAQLERGNQLTDDKVKAAEKFALGPYLSTLAGSPPQGEAAHAFYEKVAQLSGLPLDLITRQHGFVTNGVTKNLREGKIVSHYDATFAVDAPYPDRDSSHAPDPILSGVARAYGGAFAAYARNELNYKTEVTYKLLADDVTRGWDWGHGRSRIGVENDLRLLLSFDPSFRLLIGHGLTDLVTPFAETQYVLDHMPSFAPAGRVSFKLYRGGHMIYLDPSSRKDFTADAAAFYRTGETENASPSP
ncbi:MAG TPA: carboxypeptidase [Pseudolabrys sp.]|nr:carboxypeptidase [Pseudolabrys sp.]